MERILEERPLYVSRIISHILYHLNVKEILGLSQSFEHTHVLKKSTKRKKYVYFKIVK